MKLQVSRDTPDDKLTPGIRKRPSTARRQREQSEGVRGRTRAVLVDRRESAAQSRQLLAAHPHQCFHRVEVEDLTQILRAVERARSLCKHRCDRRSSGSSTH
jgi:hypothetical protein